MELLAYERKVAARDKHEGRAKGAKIKPPVKEPRAKLLKQMKEKMEKEENRALNHLRMA